MRQSLYFQHSPWWLVLIALLAILLAGWHYYRHRHFSIAQRWTLVSLRFLLLFALGFFLLKPFLQITQQERQKPILWWLEDRSLSVTTGPDSAAVAQFYEQEAPELRASLAEDWEIAYHPFGDGLGDYPRATDMAGTLSDLQGRYFRQPVGAAVVISDGIYNRGQNPLYVARGLNFPLHTVAVGDSSPARDLRISETVANEVAFLNERFPLLIRVSGEDIKPGSYKLSVSKAGGKSIFSKQLEVESADFFHREQIYIKPEEAGLQRYRIELDIPPDDQNPANNQSYFITEVLDTKQKILISGSGLHPDLAAIKNALAEDPNLALTVALEEDVKWNEEYDLYILHRPSARALNAINAKKQPVFIIAAPGSDWQALQRNFGFTLQERGNPEEIFPELNSGFSLFHLPEDFGALLQEMPPLQAPYGEVRLQGASTAMLNQRVGEVKTGRPLLLFSQRDERKFAVFMGEGFWRWRLYAYRDEESFAKIDALWTQSVRYLSTRENKRRFLVETKDSYRSGETIRLTARLFNPAGELVNKFPVNFRLRDEEDKVFEYQFQRRDPLYQLEIDDLAPGVYGYEASVKLGEETFEAQGEFVVRADQLEKMDLQARFALLREMAVKSGANFYRLPQAENLLKPLRENRQAPVVTYEKTETEPLISKWGIFFLILIFASVEWGLRKFWGNY